ncbi:MAG: hypothetical protein ACKVWV_08480 [Planctomycetota bacterium]
MHPVPHVRSASLTAAALTLLVAPSALASFTSSVVPPFRGAPCSHYAGWETFSVPFGGTNAPEVAGTTGTGATLEQLLPGAILTSGGNIYHPFAATAFEVADVVPGDLQEVVLQVSTAGSPRNYGSFILIYQDAGGTQQVLAPTTFNFLEQNAGDEELYFRWDTSAVADSILSYSLTFIATAPSMSLDAIELDARWACEPGLAYCFGDGSLSTACPCTPPNTVPNPPAAPGHGCANSLNLDGARLSASGAASPDTVVFTVNVAPNYLGFGFLVKGNQDQPAGIAASDGIRCASGQLVRFGGHTAGTNGAPVGTWTYPNTAQTTSVSAATAQPAGQSAFYQLFYRNAVANFCNSATANFSNGYRIDWP